MDVRNCKNCGRLYNYVGGMGVCPICTQELEDKFQIVKKYIRDNPKASLTDISEDNDVSVAALRRWIREERLSFTKESLVGIECESCGTMIRTGRYCELCKAHMVNNMEKVLPKHEQPEYTINKSATENRMRFLDKDRNQRR